LITVKCISVIYAVYSVGNKLPSFLMTETKTAFVNILITKSVRNTVLCHRTKLMQLVTCH